MSMKQMNISEKKIGENTFYLKSFPAFTAANVSGDLVSVLSPVLGAFVPMLGSAEGERENILNKNVEEALPALIESLSCLSGDDLERLMKKLLVDHKNISVEGPGTDGDVKLLDRDLANEVFCGDIQDMYMLCWEVIRINFGGVFKHFGTPVSA